MLSKLFRRLFSRFRPVRSSLSKRESAILDEIKQSLLSSDAFRVITLSNLLSIAPQKGVVVECGVGAGDSLIALAHLTQKQIYAFDSFEGFPDSGPNDSSAFNAADKFVYKSTSEEFVLQRLTRNGVSSSDIASKIKLVKGYFEKSLPNFNFSGKISFLHLDCDLYESYKVCLESLVENLADGAVILFDEYDSSSDLIKWPGAKKAIDEFVLKYSLRIQYSPQGKAYVVFC